MRVTDANQFFAGAEPKFIGSTTELSKLDLIVALNWYARNRTVKDAEEYAERYFRTKLKYSHTIKIPSSTFGFLCKIIMNGGILPEQNLNNFNEQVSKLSVNNTISTIVENKPNSENKLTIQDRIKEKSNQCIAELEGMFDEYISSKFTLLPIPYSILNTLEIKQTKDIIEHFRNRRKEYDDLLVTVDNQLKEGYSNFTRFQIKKLIAFFDQIIVDCLRISDETKKIITRRPRARKEKTVDQVLSKLVYCQSFPELNINSIDPKLLLGATQLWVYNTRYKKLGVYHSSDAAGFSVLGTTLKNFDESKSLQKIVKHPNITLPELLKATKIGLRTFLNKLPTKENVLTGRLGSDTLLLRVIK